MIFLRVVEFGRGLRWTACIAMAVLGTLTLATNRNQLCAQIDPAAKYQVIPIYPDYDIRLPDGLDKNKDPKGYQEAMQKRNKAMSDRRGVEKAVQDVLVGAASYQAEEVRFKAWFERVVFAEMTQIDEQSLVELPKQRQQFFAKYLQRRDIRPDVQREVVNLTRAKMLEMANGNYHPAVRCNAVLILGELNSQEASLIIEPKQAPVPYYTALGDLMNLYRAADQIDAVRVPALVGILRHAQMDGQRREGNRIPLAARYAVRDEMLKLVQAKAPPSGRTMEGHLWMQRRAIEILGALRDAGTENAVAKELESIIANNKLPLSFRCTAALAYSQLSFPKPKEIDASAAVRKIAALASAGCQQEIGQLEKQKTELKEMVARAKGIRVDDVAERDAWIDPYRLDASRRLMKYYIQCVQGAVGTDEKTGFRRNIADEPHKTFAQTVADKLDKLMKATDKDRQDKELRDNRLTNQMRAALNELDVLLLASTPPAAGTPELGLPAGGVPSDLPPDVTAAPGAPVGVALPGVPGGLPPAIPGGVPPELAPPATAPK